MDSKDKDRHQLRARAERFLEENPLFRRRYDADDLHGVVEELHVFQAELEVQNEELRRAQQELTESRDRYYDLYDFAPVGYCSLDLDGTIQEINLAGAELLGRARALLIRGPISRHIAQEGLSRLMVLYGQAMRDTARHACEVRVPETADRPARHLLLEVSARRSPKAGLAGFRMVMTDITELTEQRQRLEALNVQLEHRVVERTAELEYKNQQLTDLTAELLRAEQRERHRLAEDLHDHLAQLLVVASMRAQAAEKLACNEPVCQVLVEVKKVLCDAQRYTRTLVANLSPTVLFEEGIGPAMRYLARSMEEHGLRVVVREENLIEISKEASILLYQSVRELLFNILKHAGVNEASVSISLREGTLCVLVADEGDGFEVEPVLHGTKDKDKFGLLSIIQRMAAVSGVCTIDSRKGGGTRVALCLPASLPITNSLVSVAPAPAHLGHSGESISVLVVDDHQAVRAGMRKLLESQPNVTVVGEAQNGLDAIQQVRSLHPRAVLMDINMPGMNGIDATRQITSEFDDVTVVGFSIREDDDARAAMTQAGAKAFVTKGAPVQEVYELLKEYCG